MRARRDVFPVEWGLRIRMLLLVALDVILSVSLLVGLVYPTVWVPSGWSVAIFFVGIAWLAGGRGERPDGVVGRPVAPPPARSAVLVGARPPAHPPGAGARGVRRLWATHPALSRRLRRLERMENELQRAR